MAGPAGGARAMARRAKTRRRNPPITCVVFDLGGVLIDWNPRYLYRKLIADPAHMERFLDEVCSDPWRAPFDLGASMPDAVARLAERHPHERHLIEAYWTRWAEMLGGPVDGSVAILEHLRATLPAVYALSNWPAETFPHARARFDFLDWFDGIVISGEIGMKKPAAGIYRHLLETYDIEPSTTLFIDDAPENLAAAEALGLNGVLFTSAGRLREDLVRFDLA